MTTCSIITLLMEAASGPPLSYNHQQPPDNHQPSNFFIISNVKDPGFSSEGDNFLVNIVNTAWLPVL